MRHPNPSDSGVPGDPSGTSVSWSFSVSQGLHLHVSDQTTGSSPRATRKYDFRLLTPSTVGGFHKRGRAGSGMMSSDTRAKGLLVACGKRCVLSLRPERCKAENEKPKEAEESERGDSGTNGAMGEQQKIGQGKKRAQSGVVRTRVMVTSDTRPSTAPARTQSGRSDTNPLTPGTPGYRMVWRSNEKSHHDDLDCTSTGLHLDLYLPNYPPETRKEVDEVETERQDADTDGQIAQSQNQKHLEVVCNDGNRSCDITGGSPDAVEVDVTMETVIEQKHKTEEEEDKDGGQDKSTEKEENERHGVTETSSQDPTEECTRAVEECSGKTDDPPRGTAATHQDVLEERQKAPGAKLKSGAAHVRNSETKTTRRLMLPAPALSFPNALSRTHSSPFSLFGIRMPHAPERRPRAKTQPTAAGFYRRRIKPASERPPSLERKGSRHILKTDPGGVNGTRPKIMSPECRGCLPRKTKTTKTFVWGPQGPQETKSVSELHTRTDRWRGSD